MPMTDPLSGNLSSNDRDPELFEILGHLWSGKYLIAAVTILALAVGAFLSLRANSVYQASALMQLETRSGALALPEGMQELLGGDSKSGVATETESEIIRSRMVISAAVSELDLQKQITPLPLPILGQLPRRLSLPDTGIALLAPYQWGNERLTADLFTVPDRWLGQSFTVTVTGADSYSLVLPDGSRHDGRLRAELVLAESGVRLGIDDINAPVGRRFILKRLSLEQAVREVQREFTVTSTSRNSSILRLRFNDPDPRQAERVLDAIARAYVAQNISRSAAEAENSLSFIETQLPLARTEVERAEQALNTYRQEQNSIDVDYETRSLLERATRIEGELNALTLQEEELRKRYTINHPTYQLLMENRSGLERELEQVRKETAGLPETQKEIFNLTRDLDVAQQVYFQLLNRAQELRVVRASTVGSVRIIDTAYADGSRVSPRTGLYLAVAGGLGLVLGAAIVLLRRMLRRGIRGSEEIEKLGLPVFGTVSYAPGASDHRRQRGDLPIHALEHPEDLVVEAMRSLRTALRFGMLDTGSKAVLLTSAAPGAGKSFTAINLAVVTAQAGQRVCVIDADLRRGYLRRYLKQPKNTPGLAEYLSGEKQLQEVLHEGPVPGVSYILTGRYPPNPSELLMRDGFRTLLDEINPHYDLIIVDSPPALAVTDPVVLGRYVGATILITRHLETMAGEIEAVRRSFETAGSRLAGAVLNGYKQEEGSRYGGHYQYYNYRYSYRSERE
ncbi:polysaccharide biosynthesis tyrosine autokinase [Pseudogemmobacter bohemicus]|uniref:polysaccharide biosynthesis tyrosine autokinase n=1 Tax=Pseudogemmobacter bohemicus TaxID=2250708 RepID=UPI001E3A3B81|nr:polysaccharide biosynthesis tyrosine autokinase [Pseudogemmobacter bohemicus]